jgi:hypothetical protein
VNDNWLENWVNFGSLNFAYPIRMVKNENEIYEKVDEESADEIKTSWEFFF